MRILKTMEMILLVMFEVGCIGIIAGCFVMTIIGKLDGLVTVYSLLLMIPIDILSGMISEVAAEMKGIMYEQK